MCKATVIFEEKLGKRREGWCVYLNQSRDFTWYSDKQIKTKIAAGERINGVTVTEGGEVVMDETFTTGLLAKTGLATFMPIKEDEDSGVSKYFATVISQSPELSRAARLATVMSWSAIGSSWRL